MAEKNVPEILQSTAEWNSFGKCLNSNKLSTKEEKLLLFWITGCNCNLTKRLFLSLGVRAARAEHVETRGCDGARDVGQVVLLYLRSRVNTGGCKVKEPFTSLHLSIVSYYLISPILWFRWKKRALWLTATYNKCPTAALLLVFSETEKISGGCGFRCFWAHYCASVEKCDAKIMHKDEKTRLYVFNIPQCK